MINTHEAVDVGLSLHEVTEATAKLLGVSTQDVQNVLTQERLPENIKWDTPKKTSNDLTILTGTGIRGGTYTVEIRVSGESTLDRKAFEAAGSPAHRYEEFMGQAARKVHAITINTRDQAGRAFRGGPGSQNVDYGDENPAFEG